MAKKKKAKKKIIKKKALPKPMKSKDIPATYGALQEVRAELKSDITSVKLEVKVLETKMESGFNKVDARLEKMEATNHRMLALLEEQNSRNRTALEAYGVLYESHSEIKDRLEVVEKNQFDLANVLKVKDL